MDASQYPVTTPYGYVKGYPLHNGFHQGIDYGCPVGTPVVVNGVVIGLSGNTGYTFGPHLHLGKWLGGLVQNPLNGGFNFKSAVVTEINEDADNGKYARIQGDGFSWVYLHLSDNKRVNVGQVLQGGSMGDLEILTGIASARHDMLNELWNAAGVDPAKVTDEQAATNQAIANIDAKNKAAQALTVLKPGNYKVN